MSDDATFVHAIQATPSNNQLRLAYADWLDEQKRPGGSFLRAEFELVTLSDDSLREGLLATLRETSIGVDQSWVASMSRVPIENCLRFQFRCPKRWEQLHLTDDEGVRFCGQCREQVIFCNSIEEAQTHARFGDCIAVDLRLPRKPGDLECEMEEIAMGLLHLTDEEEQLKGEVAPPKAE